MYNYKCDGIGYTIKAGDTLYNISRRYNIPLDLIMNANPFINIYNLQIGDVICLPVQIPISYENVITYVVKPGETLDSILQQFNISYEDFMQYNNMINNTLQPGMVLIIPSHMKRISNELDEEE